MVISVGDVRPGKCFLILGGKPQVLRVRSVKAGIVAFESRGLKSKRDDWPVKGDVEIKELVSSVAREVGGDFDLTIDRATSF